MGRMTTGIKMMLNMKPNMRDDMAVQHWRIKNQTAVHRVCVLATEIAALRISKKNEFGQLLNQAILNVVSAESFLEALGEIEKMSELRKELSK